MVNKNKKIFSISPKNYYSHTLLNTSEKLFFIVWRVFNSEIVLKIQLSQKFLYFFSQYLKRIPNYGIFYEHNRKKVFFYEKSRRGVFKKINYFFLPSRTNAIKIFVAFYCIRAKDRTWTK